MGGYRTYAYDTQLNRVMRTVAGALTLKTNWHRVLSNIHPPEEEKQLLSESMKK